MGRFIIIYDDRDSLTVPYQFNDDCAGAVEAWNGSDPIACFEDRAAARRAIKISTCFAKLQESKGEVFNSDFTDPKCRKWIHIVPLKGCQ